LKNRYLFLFAVCITLSLSYCTSDDKPLEDIVLEIDISRNNNLKLSSIFRKDAEYIPLESREGHLIGEISKIVISDNYILAADFYNTASVFIFDRSGRFISQISRLGEGPFEYDAMMDFYFNEIREEICVFSFSGKLIVYDISGKGLRNIPLSTRGVKYHVAGSKIFVTGMDSEYWLDVLSEDGTKEGEYIPIKNFIGLEFAALINFSGTEDSVLFLPSLDQVFYCYTDCAVFPKYIIDFGINNIPDNIFNNCKHVEDFWLKCELNNYANTINEFAETKTHLHFSFTYGKKNGHVFYNRLNGDIKCAIDIENDIDGLHYWGIIGQVENGVIQRRWPAELKKNMQEIKSRLNPEEWNEYMTKNEHLFELAMESKEIDNPILIIYTYK